MRTLPQKIIRFVTEMETLFSQNAIADFDAKSSDTSWSKKEILGHLVDSALNNLQRFTEIHYSATPYQLRPYNPDVLVATNQYQHKKRVELVQLWAQLNKQIALVIENLPESSLVFQIRLPNEEISDLEFLVRDYVEHLEHHLNQIK